MYFRGLSLLSLLSATSVHHAHGNRLSDILRTFYLNSHADGEVLRQVAYDFGNREVNTDLTAYLRASADIAPPIIEYVSVPLPTAPVVQYMPVPIPAAPVVHYVSVPIPAAPVVQYVPVPIPAVVPVKIVVESQPAGTHAPSSDNLSGFLPLTVPVRAQAMDDTYGIPSLIA
jgi:hypothetical protein